MTDELDLVPAWAKCGVPEVAPEPDSALVPPGRPQLHFFKFPEVPGLPPSRRSVARRFAVVPGEVSGDKGSLDDSAWTASLTSISGQLERANYHSVRFREHVEIARGRREVLGGPVVSDPTVARAILCEAAGALAASRAVIDLVVRTCQLRAGLKPLKTSRLVLEEVEAQFLTAAVRILRARAAWYDELNAYRNVMEHRGWQHNGFGYFEKADSAPEANSTFHNVCLLPDRDSLRAERLPHQWTYENRRWLPDLVSDVHEELNRISEEIADAWSLPNAEPGTRPESEHPDVYLTVPQGTRFSGDKESRVLLFATKLAWKRLCELMLKQGWQVSGELISVRPIKHSNKRRLLLIAYDPETLGPKARVEVVSCASNGKLQFDPVHTFVPGEKNGPVTNTLALELRQGLSKSLYTVIGNDRSV